MATSSSSRLPEGLWPQESKKKGEEPTVRDWAELPRDALLLVLEKLTQTDVLRGAELVCRPWRQAAQDEPSLWRRIDIRRCHVADPSARWWLQRMAYAAVPRSRGMCEALLGEGSINIFIIYILKNSKHSLKSLRIISSENITDRLSNIMPHFRMLEELEISNCGSNNEKFSSTCMAVGNSCPHLKRFRLSSPRFYKHEQYLIDCEVEGITKMRGLRSLQLFAQTITTNGLISILDSCTQLESLDIRHCFNIEVRDEMMARCSGFETLKLPYDSTEDYDLEFFLRSWNIRAHPEVTTSVARGKVFLEKYSRPSLRRRFLRSSRLPLPSWR